METMFEVKISEVIYTALVLKAIVLNTLEWKILGKRVLKIFTIASRLKAFAKLKLPQSLKFH